MGLESIAFKLDVGVSENSGYLMLGVLIRRILLFRVLYWGPLFSGGSKK